MSMRILSGLMRHRRAGDEEQLSIGQLRMLAMLRERPWSLGDLAQRHHVAPSTMSRTIDALVKRALVARETDPEDRRLVIVKLTGEGHSAHAALLREIENRLTSVVEQLDEPERTKLYEGLQVLQQLVVRVAGESGWCGPEQQRPPKEPEKGES
ncbi:MAG: MarR family transcriptional regulator [Chloroflexota bacterium]